MPLWLYILLGLQAPNAFAFIIVLGVDRAVTRNFYTTFLAIKLGIIAFAIPALFMVISNDILFDKFCKGKTDDIDEGLTNTIAIPTQNLYGRMQDSAEIVQLKYEQCQANIFYWFVTGFSIGMSIWGYQVHVADLHTNNKVQQEDILAKERRKTEAENKRDKNGNIRVIKIELNLMREKLINYQMGKSI